jgi:phage I-like protein
MNAHAITRAGGDRGRNRGNPAGSAAIDTTGAPATLAIFGSALAPEAPRGEPSGATAATAAPEWIELLPAGVFNGRDGRGPFRLDDPEAVIAATGALRMESGIPIDYDHATDLAAPSGRPAPAAGWIRELRVKRGAIWGRVEWTARAASAIASREYRYVSPVFQFDPKSGAVKRLLRAGLTNNPNLYLTAIAAARTVAANDEVQAMEKFLSRLREILGADAEATSDVLAGQVAELAARASAAQSAAHAQAGDPAHYVAIAEFQKALTELNALKAERARERASAAVDEATRAGKLVPAQREWAIAYCAADPRGFESFVARQPSILSAGADPSFESADPDRDPHPRLSGTEMGICAQLGVSPTDYFRRKRGRADFLSLDRIATDDAR